MQRRMWLVMIAACSSPAPTHAPVAVARDAAVNVADVAPVARRFIGTLAPPPAGASLWPSRVCTDGGALVIEQDCGCNDAILCTVDAAIAPTLALTIRTDPTRAPHCRDCFAMVPGRCALPPLAAGIWHVQLAGAAAFDLTVDAAGHIDDAACWR